MKKNEKGIKLNIGGLELDINFLKRTGEDFYNSYQKQESSTKAGVIVSIIFFGLYLLSFLNSRKIDLDKKSDNKEYHKILFNKYSDKIIDKIDFEDEKSKSKIDSIKDFFYNLGNKFGIKKEEFNNISKEEIYEEIKEKKYGKNQRKINAALEIISWLQK